MTEQGDDAIVHDRPAAAWTSRAWTALKWVVLAAAIWYLWREGALSRDRLRLGGSVAFGLAAAFFCQAANTALIGLRCHCLFRRLGAPSRPGRQLRVHFSALLAQQASSELAYDAMRLLAGKRMGGKGSAVFAALMTDRLLGLLALTAAAAVSLAIFREGLGWLPAVAIAVLVPFALPLALVWWHGMTAGNPASRLWRMPGAGLASAVGGSVREFRHGGRTLAALFALSLAAHLCMFAAIYFCGMALERRAVTPAEALAGGAIATFTGILPLPMAGLGVGEAAFGETVAKVRGIGQAADFAPIFLVNRLLLLALGTLSWLAAILSGGLARGRKA